MDTHSLTHFHSHTLLNMLTIPTSSHPFTHSHSVTLKLFPLSQLQALPSPSPSKYPLGTQGSSGSACPRQGGALTSTLAQGGTAALAEEAAPGEKVDAQADSAASHPVPHACLLHPLPRSPCLSAGTTNSRCRQHPVTCPLKLPPAPKYSLTPPTESHHPPSTTSSWAPVAAS